MSRTTARWRPAETALLAAEHRALRAAVDELPHLKFGELAPGGGFTLPR
jgi:hypothetical protein